MDESPARRLHERYIDAMNRRDWAALGELLAPDYVEDWPQSGERVCGLENFRGIISNYPGGGVEIGSVDATSAEVYDSPEQQWVMTPTFTTIRISGGVERFTAVVKARYPNDEVWYLISIVDVREGRFLRATRFFAPVYPPPEWRAQWVQQIPESAAR